MKSKILAITAHFFRNFYQIYPYEFGKWFFWEKILVPYVNQQRTEFIVPTNHGPLFKVNLYDYIQQRLFYFGLWEPTITKYISSNLTKGDIFVDVGANIGYYSCIASKIVGDTGAVHAVEASPSIYESLCSNIKLNNQTNVKSYNMAASDKKEIIAIYKAGNKNIGLTTTRIENSDKYNFTLESEVNADTIDKIIGLESLLSARIIKIDVEGAEWQVIQGITKLLPKFSEKTEFILEISPESLITQNIDPKDIVNIFEQNGYFSYTIENKSEPSNYMKRKTNYKFFPLPDKIVSQIDVLFTKIRI